MVHYTAQLLSLAVTSCKSMRPSFCDPLLVLIVRFRIVQRIYIKVVDLFCSWHDAHSAVTRVRQTSYCETSATSKSLCDIPLHDVRTENNTGSYVRIPVVIISVAIVNLPHEASVCRLPLRVPALPPWHLP